MPKLDTMTKEPSLSGSKEGDRIEKDEEIRNRSDKSIVITPQGAFI